MKYILEGHNPVWVDDTITWGKWFETADRHVAKTAINDEINVSTVFLGVDHSFGGGPPPPPLYFGRCVGSAKWRVSEEGCHDQAEPAGGQAGRRGHR